MLDIVFIFYILTLILSASVSIVSALLAKEHHSILFFYTSLIFLGGLLNLLAETICLYRHTADNLAFNTSTFLYYFLTAASGFMMLYFIPRLVHRAVYLPFTKFRRSMHLILLISLAVVTTFEYLNNGRILRITRESIYNFIFMYSAVLLIFNSKRIKQKNPQKVLMSFSILIFTIVPLIFFQRLAGLFFFPENILFNLPYFNTLFLFVSAVLALSYGSKYLFVDKQAAAAVPIEEVVKDFDISHREEEIIQLIIKGLTNEQIASALYISTKTVKNHLYHIYHKLGVKNRLQLINKFLNK